ncbi:IS110 family transposase [Brucella sp. 10RB9215]|uniref:IS110 family transposase n=1 Tax=Brucella sp. 10RB9215 TaxID=1149953 RepID=UPI001FCEAEA5|nr:IS110 family transposase [Brucella sp. 10RB9215]
MGAILTASFIAAAGSIARFKSADAMAATAGLAPVMRQSGYSRCFDEPTAATKTSNASFSRVHFVLMPKVILFVELFTTAKDGKENAIPKRSLRSQDDASMCFGPC